MSDECGLRADDPRRGRCRERRGRLPLTAGGSLDSDVYYTATTMLVIGCARDGTGDMMMTRLQSSGGYMPHDYVITKKKEYNFCECFILICVPIRSHAVDRSKVSKLIFKRFFLENNHKVDII
jgi:hypothetical protein